MVRILNQEWEKLALEFARVGRALFEAGLNNSHSGNLSVRVGDRVVITRRGAMLAELTPEDLVSVGLRQDDIDIALASKEVNVHRAIYDATPAIAVVHTHPRSAIALSLTNVDIVPVDMEGRYYFQRVPVLGVEKAVGSKELEKELPALLKDFPVVMVRGHGAFAAGENLEEGLRISHALEWSCGIIVRCAALGISLEELLAQDKQGE